jgi:SAM-dependent methyltransferase
VLLKTNNIRDDDDLKSLLWFIVLPRALTVVRRPKPGSSLEPSKNLMRVLDQLTLCADAPILDAPCGFGRNAFALADHGYDVIAVDKDVARLTTLKRSAGSRVKGRVVAICGDLVRGRVPFGESSFSAIICVHYPVQRIISDLKAVLKRGGHFYIETFQGHGKNYLELPKAGEILTALQEWEILIYNERSVGPPGEHAVIVEALARKK